jgi:hypothetical protein
LLILPTPAAHQGCSGASPAATGSADTGNAGEGVILEYIDRRTGGPVMPTIACHMANRLVTTAAEALPDDTDMLKAMLLADRPWSGADPPIVAYVYAPDRKAARPIAHLAGFRGCGSVLHVYLNLLRI